MFLSELWPALLPVLVYVLWHWRRRNKARRSGENLPRWQDGPWFWALVVSIVLLIVLLMGIGISSAPNAGTHYQPKRLEDGIVRPGRMDP